MSHSTKATTALMGILVEAEDFHDYGGWMLDSQFETQMGSPYLLAHGLGRPVADAKTIVSVARSGEYEVWVRAKPEPMMFVTVADAARHGLVGDDWAEVVTPQGRVKLKVELRPDMPEGVVRVPHGWWLPERAEGDGTLSGAWEFADAQICPDDAEHLDHEQGVPPLKGIACLVRRLDPQPPTLAETV